MRLYDSHCHLDFGAFDLDRDDVIARARAAGVCAILVPGYDAEQWERLPAQRERYAEVRIAVGLHPHALPSRCAASTLAERALALGAVAIGECGLDRRAGRGESLDAQRAVLETHLEVARELALPVVLHCVDAHGAMLDTLGRIGPLARGGVLHGFTGPAELVPRYASLGLSFGLGGAITRPGAKRPLAAARAIPIERLLIETDAPDAPPLGAPSARNEPELLVCVLAALASLRGESERDLAERTYENAAALFGA